MICRLKIRKPALRDKDCGVDPRFINKHVVFHGLFIDHPPSVEMTDDTPFVTTFLTVAPKGHRRTKEKPMKSFKLFRNQAGKIGYILLWLLGVPIPILIVIYLVRGCT